MGDLLHGDQTARMSRHLSGRIFVGKSFAVVGSQGRVLQGRDRYVIETLNAALNPPNKRASMR
jgi:hypothetical protein